ncbi:zinc-binding dehydrogenase [Prauserella cavernicola]|uniref:Zinc-binding dehydrogenase n=1 Tax=Prauserella cavernicola TaxID=2800127 RepID=A0A934V445_9PSEU|nr:zinc-binding dehydrogenase [Prauserella cavernicola]MBK1787976.1 zinc-binding dehydrogenase [Prauserella cavernicola]
MLAVTATGTDALRPLEHLGLGEYPEPEPAPGWAKVRVLATSLNHHDLWTLRGVGPPGQRLPIVLGSEAAGVDEDGNEVIVYPVISHGEQHADDTPAPEHSVLSEVHDGTFAEYLAVPRRNLVRKPPWLSFEEAACLPGTWLTAYSMLFGAMRLPPGGTVLVQGAGGGVATALVCLGAAAGHRVWVTSRSEDKRHRALQLGAHAAFVPGQRLPERVDAVLETVGAATWGHSIRSVRAGGRIVVSGATTGSGPPAELSQVVARQLSIVGVKLGTLRQLEQLVTFCDQALARPVLNSVLPLCRAREGFAALDRGDVFGKIVFSLG